MLVAQEQFGPYRLEELIGVGGMGEVFRAFDTVRKRTVALKRLPPRLGADAAFQARFRRESELAARLSEPHIIPIHDYGEIDGQLYIDMPLVSGVDLSNCWTRDGALPPARAVDIVAQVAQALDAAHARGLVHRDVKPSNVLIAQGPRGDQDFVYLVDFGVARTTGVVDTALTATGPRSGRWTTWPRNGSPAGPTTRASTCTPWAACCTRRSPGASRSPARACRACARPPRRGSAGTVAAPVGHPPGLDEVVARGMAKDPDDRYPSAARLAAAARSAVGSLPGNLGKVSAPSTTISPTTPPHGAALALPPSNAPASTGPAPSPGDAHPLFDSRHVSRVGSALSLALGPALLTASNVLLLDYPDPDRDPSAFLEFVGSHTSRHQVAALVSVLGGLLVVWGWSERPTSCEARG